MSTLDTSYLFKYLFKRRIGYYTPAPSTLHPSGQWVPVILEPKQWDERLDPEVHVPDAINATLKPCPSDWLECVEISTLVNSPRNNRAEVLEPLKAAE